jgi:hypothetical protein
MSLAPAPSTETGKGPTYLTKSGKYVSITELGRIYDPIQWKPNGFPPKSSAEFQQKWKDSWKSNMTKDPNYGCASTLRIGSPEFLDFDTDDSRAARLVDLFCVSDRTDTRGLVNVNTAGRNVLRALGAGLQIQEDTAIAPSTVFGPTTSQQADKFADAVIACRPFLATSQLSGILSNTKDNTSKLFGNDSQWTTGGPTEWNDTAREEYFERMLNLTAVRSRNFRIFVTGQAIDKDGKRVLSTVSKVFQIYLNPMRDSTGKSNGQQAQITYEKEM